MRNGGKAVEFLMHLQASGLSTIRVVRYAMCLPKLLPVIDEVRWTKGGRRRTSRSRTQERTTRPGRSTRTG
jgi:hypothetical protein